MSKQAKQQFELQSLRSLAQQPGEQVRYALELLKKEHRSQVVSEALEIVSNAAIPEARPILLQLYDYYDAAGVKRDASGHLRSTILDALQPIANPADCALAEHATTTYEFLPPRREESTARLRAAGLVLLSTLDPLLTSYRCARLLVDPHTSTMSGEPALTAVRILANQANYLPHQSTLLPLYTYALNNLNPSDGREYVPEVAGECLKHLAAAPASVAESLFLLYTAYAPGTQILIYQTRTDVELLGLFDLLLAHSRRSTYLDFIEEFLQTTSRFEVYRYLVTVIVANHESQVWRMLLKTAQAERDRQKVEILITALTLVKSDPSVADLLRELQQRL